VSSRIFLSRMLLATAVAASMTPAVARSQEPAAQSSEVKRLASLFANVAERVRPSVVQLDVAVRDSSQSASRWFKGLEGYEPVRRGLGSGIIISPDGHILTNNHVIDGALAISVRLADGRLLPATCVGRDPATDLAVVKVQATGLQPARLADSDQARVGEWVLAVGSPFGLGHTVTTGVLSAKGRGGLGVNAVEDYLQTDASINPGNSGGPLVNLDGQVIGVNTMMVGRGQGIGFAVPSNMAKRVVEQIVRTGRVQRAWIGLGVQDVTPELASEINVPAGSGALVNQVAQGGPAHQAHLQAGDIIHSVGGRAVRDAQDLMREVLAHDVGEKVKLEVTRGGQKYVTEVVLTGRNEPPPPPLPMQQVAQASPTLGLSLRDVPAGVAGPDGRVPMVAQVVRVAPGSYADRAGLMPGDFIVQADGMSLPSTEQVAKALEDGGALLLVRRSTGSFFTSLRK